MSRTAKIPIKLKSGERRQIRMHSGSDISGSESKSESENEYKSGSESETESRDLNNPEPQPKVEGRYTKMYNELVAKSLLNSEPKPSSCQKTRIIRKKKRTKKILSDSSTNNAKLEKVEEKSIYKPVAVQKTSGEPDSPPFEFRLPSEYELSLIYTDNTPYSDKPFVREHEKEIANRPIPSRIEDIKIDYTNCDGDEIVAIEHVLIKIKRGLPIDRDEYDLLPLDYKDELYRFRKKQADDQYDHCVKTLAGYGKKIRILKKEKKDIELKIKNLSMMKNKQISIIKEKNRITKIENEIATLLTISMKIRTKYELYD